MFQRGMWQRLTVLAFGVGYMGCDPIDTQNGIDPLPGIDAQVVTQNGVQIWQTKRDNPPIWSRMRLRDTQYAIRGPLPGSEPCPAFGGCADAWEYGRFNLTAAHGPLGGLLGDPLATWPLGIGLYEGPDGTCSTCDGPDMPWEAHGLRLAPRFTGAPLEGITEVQARRDDYDRPNANEGAPGRFQLSPDVAVVPIRLIVTNPSGDEDFSPGWYSQRLAEVLFDDLWHADIDINNETDPPLSPAQVVGTWSHRVACRDSSCSRTVAAQPDVVWEQCNIQFRITDYRMCTVPKRAWINELDGDGACNPNAAASQATVIKNAVRDCIGNTEFAKPITTVILTGLLQNPLNPCKKVFGFAQSTQQWVYVEAGAIGSNDTKFVLSHELGHRLGLNHPDDNLSVCPTPKSLMCKGALEQTDYIRPFDCGIAWSKARTLQVGF